MRRIKALAIFNTLSFITQLVFVGIVQASLISDKSAADVSTQYETLFTPADLTYGIWVVIYTILGISCLYQIIMAYKHDRNNPGNDEIKKMGAKFILINLAASAWLIAWANEQLWAATLFIFVQLIALVMLHSKLHIYRTDRTPGVKLMTHFPMSVYLGWISFMAISTTGSMLQWIGWKGSGITSEQWAIIMIAFLVILSILMILARKNIYFGLAIAWGLFGIITKQNISVDSLNDPVVLAAWAGIGVIGLLCIVQLVRNLHYKKPREIYPSASMPLK